MNQTVAGLQQKLTQTSIALAVITHQQIKQPTIKQMKLKNHYAYGNADTGFFNKILPILIGFFVFFFVFLISGMALLRERTSGTLDRLLATPVKRYEIVFGYLLSYGVLAIIQTLVFVLVTILILGVQVVGNIGSLVVVNLLLALVALSFGILLSTFANSFARLNGQLGAGHFICDAHSLFWVGFQCDYVTRHASERTLARDGNLTCILGDFYYTEYYWS